MAVHMVLTCWLVLMLGDVGRYQGHPFKLWLPKQKRQPERSSLLFSCLTLLRCRLIVLLLSTIWWPAEGPGEKLLLRFSFLNFCYSQNMSSLLILCEHFSIISQKKKIFRRGIK